MMMTLMTMVMTGIAMTAGDMNQPAQWKSGSDGMSIRHIYKGMN